MLRPLTPYGATKAAAEMLMSAYTASYGVRCASLWLTNVYGPGMALKDSIVARIMRAIRTGSTFEIYGDGRQVRDYVYVDDVVAAVRLALGSEDWHGPVVIGCRSARCRVLEVIDARPRGHRGGGRSAATDRRGRARCPPSWSTTASRSPRLAPR